MDSRLGKTAAWGFTLAFATCLATLAPHAAAQEQIRFDDTSTLSVEATEEGTATEEVVVLNNGAEAPVSVSFVPTGKSKAAVAVAADPSTLAPFGATSLTLTMTDIPTDGTTTGVLVLSSDQVGAASRPMTLAPATSNPNYIKLLTLLPLAAAFLFAVVMLFRLQRNDKTKFDKGTRLGAADWKFSDSWASNLTAGGALLGTVVAGSVLPDEPHLLTKAQYGALNLYFGLLVAVAAFLYNGIVAKKEVPADPAAKPPVPVTYRTEGFVWTYLVASTLTLWAVWGEVGTLYVMMTDIVGEGSFTSLASWLLLVGSLVVLVVGGLYAWHTIGWNVAYYREQPSSTTRAAGQSVRQQLRAERPSRAEALPRFSLL